MKQFETPILFLIFNRPDVTGITFSKIREIQPRYLFIASDGPRPGFPEDFSKCIKTRDIVLSMIDWKCELKTLFRDKNLGCGKGPAEAITWFFEQVENGIILEDDCLPVQSFFYYCSDILKRYKDDTQVMHISGTNWQDGIIRGEADYYFSTYPGIWGWATWANRWSKFKYRITDLGDFINERKIDRIAHNKNEMNYHLNNFRNAQQMSDDNLHIWDFQWKYVIFKYEGYSVTPNFNLVSNIGFIKDATHTKDSNHWAAACETQDMTFPMHHPFKIGRNEEADLYYCKKFLPNNNSKSKILQRIKRAIGHMLYNPTDQIPYYYGIVLNRLKLRLAYKKVYVMGDSHTEIFDYLQKKPFKNRFYFDVTSIGGATAQGLRNPNSKTNALAILKNKLHSITDKTAPVIFQLGEVDTGFVIWYRALKYQVSIDIEFKSAIRTYIEFLLQVKDKGFKNILVLAAPLPTIEDGQDWGEVATARKDVTASKKERTLLTLRYNNLLKRLCSFHGFQFVDTDIDLLDKQSGLIHNKFLNEDPNNHHLSIRSYSKLVYKKLKSV